jgi:hypothetical protein
MGQVALHSADLDRVAVALTSVAAPSPSPRGATSAATAVSALDVKVAEIQNSLDRLEGDLRLQVGGAGGLRSGGVRCPA